MLECFQWNYNYDIEKVKLELADKLEVNHKQIVLDKMKVTSQKYPLEKAKVISTKYNKL